MYQSVRLSVRAIVANLNSAMAYVAPPVFPDTPSPFPSDDGSVDGSIDVSNSRDAAPAAVERPRSPGLDDPDFVMSEFSGSQSD